MRCISLALLASVLAWSAEPSPAPAVAPTVQAPPAPPAVDPAVADLRPRLPQIATVVERDGRLWWQGRDAAESLPFVSVDERLRPVVATVCGPVAVQRRLVESGRTDAIAVLLAQAALAKEAGLTGELQFAEGPLTGLALRTADALVLAGGVLRQQQVPATDRAGEPAALRQAIAALVAELPKLDMDEAARRALGAVLDKLPAAEHTGDIDDASPAFCRRVVRSGWLRQFFPAIETDDRIEAALRAATGLRPVKLLSGPGGELAEVRDAFGAGGWILRSATRSAWLADHPEPTYFGGMPALATVVEVEPGSDPLADAAAPLAARTWRQVDEDWLPVASWRQGGALTLDGGDWAGAVPRNNRAPHVADWLPAHLLVTSLHGDALALATTHGAVTPPRDASTPEGERFLAEAARALPDAAHLDLIGQYLLQYVYDSPDPRRPTLIGNKQSKGDIHQTALQTLATAAGGMIRGDCDDLAELYETIAERQGRTAHVIGVPGHAACAWAERRADTWHVYVLQTGPALEFSDADPKMGLQKALGSAYKHFDDSDTFDPNGLGLLLRFTNENQRGSWRLSYRIFEDPEYARIMIDVQKDWHFSTYQRGIRKMHALIDANEREKAETANYRELSGLYSFTGQYALSAEFHRKAIELTRDDPVSTLYMDIELVGHLFDAGKAHQAREVAIDLLERQIPAQSKALGPSLTQVGAQLAGVLARNQARDLALRSLRPALAQFNTRLLELLSRGRQRGQAEAALPVAGLNVLGDWLESPDFDQNVWDNHPALQQFRRLAQYLAGTAIACLEGHSQAELTGDTDLQWAARFVQVWLDRIALRDVDEPAETLFRYATAGKAYATLLGRERFLGLIDAAPAPGLEAGVPRRRVGGIAQMALDAGWVRLSPTWWSGELFELFDRDKDAFDPALALRLADRCLEAAAKISGTPFDHPRIALQVHLTGVVRALIAKDEPGLRQLLRVVKQRADKDWYDDTAQWLGDAARRLDPAWYATVLKAWDEEVGYKPKYFWISWRAALNKAPKHALMAAELAAKRFSDDPAFQDELQFMRGVLGQ